MDISKAFSFVFEDERWVSKILIGGLIFLLSMLGMVILVGVVGLLIIYGYMLKVAENVSLDVAKPLPEWTDFGDLLKRGFHGFVIALVYSLPVLLLSGVVWCVAIAPLLAAGGDDDAARQAAMVTGGLANCITPLILVVSIAFSIFMYAGLARYVATNNLGAALRIGEVIGVVRHNWKPWIILALVGILAGFVGQIGIVACGIGVLFTAFYSQCVMGHALGQTVMSELKASSIVDMPPDVTPPPTTVI